MDLLTPGVGLIFWQTFVFLLLVVLLRLLAWKPILKSLKDREESIQDSLSLAEKAREEMSKLKSDNEKLLKEAREEREKILREARDVAAKLKDEAQSEARESANRILEEARAAINVEKQAALKDIKTQVAMFSLDIAGKLLRKNLESDPAQQELIASHIKDLKVN